MKCAVFVWNRARSFSPSPFYSSLKPHLRFAVRASAFVFLISHPSTYTLHVLDSRRCTRSVLRFATVIRIRRLSTRVQLPLPRRLCWPRQTIPRNHLPSPRLQDQVPRELLPPAREPRVCLYQSHIRLLRRVYAHFLFLFMNSVILVLTMSHECYRFLLLLRQTF